ncbi:hypothetical protein [Qipengyuania qiaonensis]|uniref:Tetratricopeptide repeat protein n=1 Tax=Qipengyuania qiaonensis TaxID=2867240 RepID=A0ABS7J484_9SPHN|nr:hypothetical protein [Qipengyuania qiaonensis]MBX7482139.1 hypothetical protein [Qipengyuania qiaonensis]
MTDWYRNTTWDEDIGQAFDKKLGRAKHKAQYLNIQAYTLLAHDPLAAAELARRAVATGDVDQEARARLYLGTALAMAGDVDSAVDALEEAIAVEQRNPASRTGAFLDQALLIAMSRRNDMYEIALERLDSEPEILFEQEISTALIAAILIRHELGHDMSEPAARILGLLESFDAEAHAPMPSYLSIDTLRSRLSEVKAGSILPEPAPRAFVGRDRPD